MYGSKTHTVSSAFQGNTQPASSTEIPGQTREGPSAGTVDSSIQSCNHKKPGLLRRIFNLHVAKLYLRLLAPLFAAKDESAKPSTRIDFFDGGPPELYCDTIPDDFKERHLIKFQKALDKGVKVVRKLKKVARKLPSSNFLCSKPLKCACRSAPLALWDHFWPSSRLKNTILKSNSYTMWHYTNLSEQYILVVLLAIQMERVPSFTMDWIMTSFISMLTGIPRSVFVPTRLCFRSGRLKLSWRI